MRNTATAVVKTSRDREPRSGTLLGGSPGSASGGPMIDIDQVVDRQVEDLRYKCLAHPWLWSMGLVPGPEAHVKWRYGNCETCRHILRRNFPDWLWFLIRWRGADRKRFLRKQGEYNETPPMEEPSGLDFYQGHPADDPSGSKSGPPQEGIQTIARMWLPDPETETSGTATVQGLSALDEVLEAEDRLLELVEYIWYAPTLKERHRQAVFWVLWSGNPYEVAAELMGIQPNRVQRYVHEALAQVRRSFGGRQKLREYLDDLERHLADVPGLWGI